METIKHLLKEYLVRAREPTMTEAKARLAQKSGTSAVTLDRLMAGQQSSAKTVYKVLIALGVHADDAMKIALKQETNGRHK